MGEPDGGLRGSNLTPVEILAGLLRGLRGTVSFRFIRSLLTSARSFDQGGGQSVAGIVLDSVDFRRQGPDKANINFNFLHS